MASPNPIKTFWFIINVPINITRAPRILCMLRQTRLALFHGPPRYEHLGINRWGQERVPGDDIGLQSGQVLPRCKPKRFQTIDAAWWVKLPPKCCHIPSEHMDFKYMNIHTHHIYATTKLTHIRYTQAHRWVQLETGSRKSKQALAVLSLCLTSSSSPSSASGQKPKANCQSASSAPHSRGWCCFVWRPHECSGLSAGKWRCNSYINFKTLKSHNPMACNQVYTLKKVLVVFYARPMRQCSWHQILNRMTKYASKMNFEQFCRHPEHHKRRFIKTGVPKHQCLVLKSLEYWRFPPKPSNRSRPPPSAAAKSWLCAIAADAPRNPLQHPVGPRMGPRDWLRLWDGKFVRWKISCTSFFR